MTQIPIFLEREEYEILHETLYFASKNMDTPYIEPLEYEKLKNRIAEKIIEYYRKEKEENELPF